MQQTWQPPSDMVSAWVKQALEPELPEQERVLRDRFVEEYLTDYDATNACSRLGFSRHFAIEYGKRFLHEPYVLQQIKLRETEIGIGDQPERDKVRVRTMLFQEAMHRGEGSSHSARIAALSKLASILGMDAPVKTESKLTVTSPVQFYIPSNGRDEEKQ